MSEQDKNGSSSSRRDKLGLALSGGGFRASLFHLGVLRRMAELDLLRHVEVISTVSGGSIIGALYVLFLKQHLDAKASLTRDDYLIIVREVQNVLVTGIQKNLRTRLFRNPLGVLRVLLTQYSLGKRMSRLYERYLYRDPVERLQQRPWWKLWRPGKIRILDVRFRPGGGEVTGGLEAYNTNPAVDSKVPNLILNATSLNSGAPFRFSSVEIGDWRLGLFRYDEVDTELRPRKRLLHEVPFNALQQALAMNTPQVTIRGEIFSRPMVLSAAWWRATREGRHFDPLTVTRLFQIDSFPGALSEAEYGLLRRAKLAAWYIRRGLAMNPPITGGVPRDVQVQRFWAALLAMDERLTAALSDRVAADPPLLDELLDFILHLYYLRSAEVMSPRIAGDWDRLTLGEAVGASACFPPVFPPFLVLGFYDDLWVTRLGLTDGGVYDNLGVTTLLDEDCTYIIASDTGGLFDVEQRVSAGRLGMMVRVGSVLMDHVGGLQRTALRECRRVSRAIGGVNPPNATFAQLQPSYQLQGLVYFHINSPILGATGLQQNLDSNALARLRTDLDAFGDVEISALVNHGYDAADRYLRRYLDNSPYVNRAYWQPATDPPMPLSLSADRIQRILAVGRSRFFRALKLGAPVSWIFTLGVLGFVVWITLDLHLSVRDIINWIASQVIKWIEELLPWLAPGWGSYPFRVGVVILIVIAAGLIGKEIWPRLVARFRYRHPRLIRKFVFAVKWVRSFMTNVLWLIGGAPVWIALIISACAWVSYLFYNLPFLSKTRSR